MNIRKTWLDDLFRSPVLHPSLKWLAMDDKLCQSKGHRHNQILSRIDIMRRSTKREKWRRNPSTQRPSSRSVCSFSIPSFIHPYPIISFNRYSVRSTWVIIILYLVHFRVEVDNGRIIGEADRAKHVKGIILLCSSQPPTTQLCCRRLRGWRLSYRTNSYSHFQTIMDCVIRVKDKSAKGWLRPPQSQSLCCSY